MISLSGTSNVAQLPIQPKKQDNKKSSGVEVGGFGRGGLGHIGEVFIKYRGVRTANYDIKKRSICSTVYVVNVLLAKSFI